jgi:hypothetical protein
MKNLARLILTASIAALCVGCAGSPAAPISSTTANGDQAAAIEAKIVWDAAFLAYLNGKPDPAVVQRIVAADKARDAALTAFLAAEKTGTATTEAASLSAAQAAVQAVMTANDIVPAATTAP